jgi:hypothetical protein
MTHGDNTILFCCKCVEQKAREDERKNILLWIENYTENAHLNDGYFEASLCLSDLLKQLREEKR